MATQMCATVHDLEEALSHAMRPGVGTTGMPPRSSCRDA
jgi:hypothetical protein